MSRKLASSIGRVGLLQPLVVRAAGPASDEYLLLDGYRRHQALQKLQVATAECLITPDSAAAPHAPQVCHLTAFQMHEMVLRALGRGVTEAELCRELALSRKVMLRRRDLTRDLCPEAIALMRRTSTPQSTYDRLRCVKPARQVEMARLIVATYNFSEAYAEALVAATAPGDLTDRGRRSRSTRLTPKQIDRMEGERAGLEHPFLRAFDRYGMRSLQRAVLVSYLRTLLENARIRQFLLANHPAVHDEIEALVGRFKSKCPSRVRKRKEPASGPSPLPPLQ